MENICEYHRFVRAGGDAICLLSIALPAHSLRSFAIGTMFACYETNCRAGIMEYPQVREKRAARRQPVSPTRLFGFAFQILLSCGVPVFAVCVVGEESFLVNEVSLLVAAFNMRGAIDSLECSANALVPVVAVDMENCIAFAHVRIDEDIIWERLVDCEECLLSVDVHSVEHLDVVVDELDHDIDDCVCRIIYEGGAPFGRLLVFLVCYMTLSQELGELSIRCGIIPVNALILLDCLRACLACLFLILFKCGEVGELLLPLLDELVITLAVGLELDFRHCIRLSFGACSYQ